MMNSAPLSESIPLIGKGNAAVISSSAASTQRCALFFTARGSVQPVAMSVTSRLWQKSPRGSPPSCPTQSISTNPGLASSQSAQVRIGIWLLSSEPGLVPERPLSRSRARSPASRRSIVAAEIETSRSRTSSLTLSSPTARSRSTISGRNGAMRAGPRLHHRPHRAQRRDHLVGVDRWPGPPRAHHRRLERPPKRLTGVVTVPARQLAQLVENDLLAGPVGPPIPRRDRLRHCLALAQRQPHPLRVS